MDSHQAFLEESVVARPELAETFSELGDLYQRKLWHQLTEAVEKAVERPELRQDGFLLQLYQQFIAGFAARINLLKLAQFAVAAAQELREPQEGVAFTEDVISSLDEANRPEEAAQAALYLRSQVASYRIAEGELPAARAALDGLERDLAALPTPDPLVAASVHRVAMEYRRARGQHAEFFRAALRYLSFVDQSGLEPAERLALASDVALAALLGEDVYDFGALLLHPIVDALRESPDAAWLLELLQAFHEGDVRAYDRACSTHAARLNARPELVANERKLREKVTVACLLAFLHALPPNKKRVPLADIAERTGLPLEGAEFLVLKALGLHVIDGRIDGVQGTLEVTWVAPRILTKPGLSELRARLDQWASRVEEAATKFEEEAQGVVVAA